MISELTVKEKIHFRRGRNNQVLVEPGPPVPEPPKPAPAGRVPRVARLMALALRFDKLIREGAIADQADLARLGHVSRSRTTQILNFLQLAPDIQEAILFLPLVDSGRDPIRERHLRSIAAVLDWRKQRKLWRHLVDSIDTEKTM